MLSKLVKIFGLWVTFFTIVFSSLQAYESNSFSLIPREDQKILEDFFSYLFLEREFSYVLFGSKPMCTINYSNTIEITSEQMRQHPMFQLKNWWNTWEKYQHLFPSDHFYFFAQEKDGWLKIFLINKRTCLKAIEDNLHLFQQYIGRKLLAEELYQQIITSNDLFDNGLNGSHALFGILLGYGKKNAVRFEKYHSKKMRSILSYYKSSIDYTDFNFEELLMPCFASFSSSETKNLMKKYNYEKKKIKELLSCEHHLDLIFSRFCLDQ